MTVGGAGPPARALPVVLPRLEAFLRFFLLALTRGWSLTIELKDYFLPLAGFSPFVLSWLVLSAI